MKHFISVTTVQFWEGSYTAAEIFYFYGLPKVDNQAAVNVHNPWRVEILILQAQSGPVISVHRNFDLDKARHVGRGAASGRE